jgi:acetylornithine deacetylase/succinyl-diaminopimelate desuccinylase-like protein
MLHTYLDYMKQFLAFRSISTDPQYKGELAATADFLVQLLTDHGFTAQAITGYSNPIVVGQYVVDPSIPTYLIYGHYDVQPADISE